MPRFVIHIEKIGRIGLMNNTEFYERLGVDKSASQDEIKKAYRKLSKKYHPDINHEEGAEAKYKEIQEAYETLAMSKSAMYDQYVQPMVESWRLWRSRWFRRLLWWRSIRRLLRPRQTSSAKCSVGFQASKPSS